MSIETETVLDRRLLRRRLGFWRAAAIVVAAIAVGALAISTADSTMSLAGGKHIARVSLEGMITEDRDQLRMFKKLAEDKRVAAVLLYVNSPGGTTAGGEALFEAIRNVSKTKPVVAQFGTVAASAAYMAGIATDRIVARGNTITGSVGVIFQWPDVTQLLDKVGVKMNEVKSGPLKAVPSPFQPIDEAARAQTVKMVMDTQKWFLSLVASRRGIDTKNVDGLEQGRVFSGREALTFKLVDQLGGEAEALTWLEQERKIPQNLKLIDWKPKRDTSWSWVRLSLSALTLATGQSVADTVSELFNAEPILARLRLDGLVSVWQGSER